MQRLVKHRFSTHYHSHASHASKQPYQKATERSGTTHSNSWKAEIKFLSAKKIPSHLCSFKWKPRHLTTMLMFSSGKKKKKQQKNNFPKGRKKLIIPKLLPHILKKDIFISYLLIRAFFRALGSESRATHDCSLARLSYMPVESSPVLPSVDDYDKIQKHVFAINSSG